MNISYEEQQLMSIYNPGTREGLIEALTKMSTYLSAEEKDLSDLTQSAILKLNDMSNEEYESLDLFPDFDEGEIYAE